MENTYRLSMSLNKPEKALYDRLQKAMERRLGVRVPYTNIVRFALKALAEQEGVK
jgi:hypothetical protein